MPPSSLALLVLDEWTSHDGDRLRIVESGGAPRLQWRDTRLREWSDTQIRKHSFALFNRLAEVCRELGGEFAVAKVEEGPSHA